MKIQIAIFFFLFTILCPVLFAAGEPDAKSWKWEVRNGEFTVSFQIPSGYYAYAATTEPELSQKDPAPVKPEPKKKNDPLLGDMLEVYPGPGTFVWRWPLAKLTFPLTLSAEWQLCREAAPGQPAACLLPGQAVLAVFRTEKALGDPASALPPGTEDAMDNGEDAAENIVLIREYKFLRSESGYLAPRQFIGFLENDTEAYKMFSFAERGVLMTLLLALFGGLALNLTPCVLPLIPVNLAVIGAASNTGSNRRDRILRGSLYGAGIAVTYGALGIFAVLTGTTFGQLDASWIFNLLAAVIFLVLGLAMFDIFHIDFSGAGGKFRMPSGAHLGGVFLLGALSAILAGACVAPVLVAALVQASSMVAAGNYAGLFLPLLVGIGMALPWPFAAAGLSLFPKPGAWMNHVKHILGILILLLCAYYFWTAGSLLFFRDTTPSAEAKSDISNYERINQALAESARTGKPVLLDFWATWCKACKLMEHNTFPNPGVQKAMENVILVKLQAEQPSEASTAAMLKEFRVSGLPTFVLLKPEAGDATEEISAPEPAVTVDPAVKQPANTTAGETVEAPPAAN